MRQVMQTLVMVAAIFLNGAVVAAERAPAYPTKPIRVIVPFGPGGGADLTARLIGPRLTEKFGQPVVTDNRPAASGILGNELLAKAAPDGHTLGIATSTLSSAPAIYKKLPYDALRDFAPITQAFYSALVVVVHPSLPINTIKELIDHARANPGKLNYGTSGQGGPPHIAGEMLKSMAKIQMTPIAYKGIGPVLTALLGNEVQLTFSNTFSARPHIQAGRMRSLAVTSLKRLSSMTELPTVSESGLPGYEAGLWFGVIAPVATPKTIITKLNQEIVTIMRSPEVSKVIVTQDGEVVAGTPEAFAKVMRDETVSLGKIMRAAGIVPE